MIFLFTKMMDAQVNKIYTIYKVSGCAGRLMLRYLVGLMVIYKCSFIEFFIHV
jgi:hypothetical protein